MARARDAPTAARALAAILLKPRELYIVSYNPSILNDGANDGADIHDNRRRVSRQRTPCGKHNERRNKMRPATIVGYSLPDDFQRNTHALGTGAIAAIVKLESLGENLPV